MESPAMSLSDTVCRASLISQMFFGYSARYQRPHQRHCSSLVRVFIADSINGGVPEKFGEHGWQHSGHVHSVACLVSTIIFADSAHCAKPVIASVSVLRSGREKGCR